MINILFISHYLNVAGTETFMMNVLRNINRKHFHIDFLIFSEEESIFSREAEELGALIYRLPSRRTGLKYYKSLERFFKKHAIDYLAVHFCGGSVSSIAPLYYAYKYKIPVRIVHSHNSNCEGIHNMIFHKVNRLFLSILCSNFLACSSKAARFFFLNKKNVVVIKNGIDIDAYTFDCKRRENFRKKFGISPLTRVIGHIGRFENVKNHSFIIDIFKRFNEKETDSVLILVGTGSLLETIKMKIENLGLSHKVYLLGERSDVPDVLFGLDCFLMPSLFEGLPFVLVEAQTTGLPCVVSNTINKDVKISQFLHFVHLDDDVDKWVNVIQYAMQNLNRSHAAEYVKETGFDIKSTIRYLENIYMNKLI